VLPHGFALRELMRVWKFGVWSRAAAWGTYIRHRTAKLLENGDSSRQKQRRGEVKTRDFQIVMREFYG
jgi:hypothetical protein